MHKKIWSTAYTMICIGSLFSCEDSSIQSESNTRIDSSYTSVQNPTSAKEDTLVQGTLKLYPLRSSPLFEDAILNLNSPNEGGLFKTNVVNFNYDIKNFELTAPTLKGECVGECANSLNGQHIHLILNNEPYQAKYTTDFSDTLKDGHYVALSFLSRSYHESIKHYDAYDLRQFTVGATKIKMDLTKPFLFYSRPKGEYKGKNARKILLDFYVVNAQLAANDYKVRVTINDAVFILTNWEAYIIEGLPIGSHRIKIELLDKNEQLVNSTFNSTERTIVLSE